MAERRTTAIVFAAAMALAGFLLFQIQPVLAKFILPWFGGSATTWIVAMLFFQAALLAGYGYAYLIALRFSLAGQISIQIALVVLSLLLLPITPSDTWKPADPSAPTGRIILLLAASAGIPYALLASASPMLSRWLACAGQGLHPARFFAAANLGSFLGLLSYPFVFEPWLTSHQQTVLWSWGYALYGALLLACALATWPHARGDAAVDAQAVGGAAGGRDPLGRWVWYPALASVLLMATTNGVTQWTAVVPFLWVLPLALYLLTFVIAFGHRRLYGLTPCAILFALFAAAAMWLPFPETSLALVLQICVQCGAMFLGCLICHAEAAALQPEPRRLPKFYLALAAGGAGGGVAVAVIAPQLFSDYFEYPIALGVTGAMACCVLLRNAAPAMQRWAGAGIAAVATAIAMAGAVSNELVLRTELLERVRNFYGVVSVLKKEGDQPDDATIVMRQAGVTQGMQFAAPARRMEPVCAYDGDSAIGLVLSHHAKVRAGGPDTRLRIGVAGLGAGMIAALGRPGDVIDYYELNPAIAYLARRHFTFLKDGKADTRILPGDARLVMERQAARGDRRNFDILVLNAFRGASPPLHLMTREAFETYLAHLAPGGVLAINFELDTFEIAPLHRGMAKALGLEVRWLETRARPGCDNPVSWALYTKDRALFDVPQLRAALSPWRDNSTRDIVWTDKNSNLMSILNWRQ